MKATSLLLLALALRPDVITLGPQMLLSTHFRQMRELLPQEAREVALEQIRNVRWTKPWRRTYKHMDMIDIRFQG
jgi:hypothetical protein